MSRAGSPARWAVAVSGVVFLGLLVSLAPSVTLWDAGEFIAAMKVLGIPHPPGTPLFVMLGHTFARVVPFGEYAFRTNLLSALFASAGAGFWFLVLWESLGRSASPPSAPAPGPQFRVAAAIAGALIASFTFSNWLNSNETEVYAAATFSVSAICWLMLRWRAHRSTPRARRDLLLVTFLLGLAIGNHLLGLLAGPAAMGFMAVELRRHPAADPAERGREWAEAGLLAAVWTLLVGVGLGSSLLMLLGAGAVLASLGFAARQRVATFGLVLLGLGLVGVTSYLFLYLRAGQGPPLNEADPSTWPALLDVIRRAQYPRRTPFDDPTFPHGDPANPGRGLRIIALQLATYVQYFDWQWASGLRTAGGGFPLQVPVTLAFVGLGIAGVRAQWRSDPGGAGLLLILFLVTGLGLVGYMNFKPGFSLGYAWYPDSDQHEVRERDYFFVVSFLVWGLWAGLGLRALARRLASHPRFGRFSRAVWVGAAVPFVLNFPAADRRAGPDARLAGDFAYDLLNSVPPYGILFTYGDNDTFPLWWAQEVAGIRRDVTVICLALAETDWYMRQLRDQPIRPFDSAGAPPVWRRGAGPKPEFPLHTMSDADIAGATPRLLGRDLRLSMGVAEVTLPARTVLSGKDFLAIRVLQQNAGRRPIAWAVTAAGQYYGLDRYVVQRGLVLELMPEPVDTTRTGLDRSRLMGVPLDVPATERLMEETYRYAGLLERPRRELESAAAGIASTLGLPYAQLALAAQAQGDTARMARYLDRATRLTADPAILSRIAPLPSRLPSAKR